MSNDKIIQYTGEQVIVGKDRNKEVKKLNTGDEVYNSAGKLDKIKNIENKGKSYEYISIVLSDKTTFKVSLNSYIPLFDIDKLSTVFNVQGLYLLNDKNLITEREHPRFFINPLFLYGSTRSEINPFILGLILGCSGKKDKIQHKVHLSNMLNANVDYKDIKLYWDKYKLRGEELSKLHIVDRISIIQGILETHGYTIDTSAFFASGCWTTTFLLCKLIRSIGGIAIIQPNEREIIDFTKKPSVRIYFKDLSKLFITPQNHEKDLSSADNKLKRFIKKAEKIKSKENVFNIELESGYTPLLFDYIAFKRIY